MAGGFLKAQRHILSKTLLDLKRIDSNHSSIPIVWNDCLYHNFPSMVLETQNQLMLKLSIRLQRRLKMEEPHEERAQGQIE
mmetsp:Transcript_25456/g.48876  ORF Transcript_25456/g.48876 Transcript_25456/m.48876 type:complete len:81 (+) Transcript_25456:779-1021(+)